MIGVEKSGTTLAERHPDWPPVKLHFHFGPHGTADNFKSVPGLLEGADVYCYENANGPKNTEVLTQISNYEGGSDPAVQDFIVDRVKAEGKPIRGTHSEPEVRALAGTGIVIGHFDTAQDDSELATAHKNSAENYLVIKDTYEATLEHLRSSLADLGNHLAPRDALMLGPTAPEGEGPVTAGRFEQEMGRILTEHPELKEKPDGEPVRVVDTHGHAHTALFHRARAAGVDVERSFAYMPQVFSPVEQVVRKIAIGKEPTKDLLTQCFVDEVLRSALAATAQCSESMADSDIVQYTRARSAAFTEADARVLFDAMRDPTMSTVLSVLEELLQEKDFDLLPMSREELYEDIAEEREAQIRKKEEVKRRDKERRRQER
jgi:hypothetical protein